MEGCHCIYVHTVCVCVCEPPGNASCLMSHRLLALKPAGRMLTHAYVAHTHAHSTWPGQMQLLNTDTVYRIQYMALGSSRYAGDVGQEQCKLLRPCVTWTPIGPVPDARRATFLGLPWHKPTDTHSA